jgi:outer membrane receptor protein involved in Fe transport
MRVVWHVALIAEAFACATALADEPLEEIIVTATKRETRLVQVPFSLHVISADELARTGARGFRDYMSKIPGASFSDVGYFDAKLTVRGISTDIYSEVRPLTAVYLDEVPVTDPGAHYIVQSPINPRLVDIARVEVLRGPQGTLYGASSMGGAIRVITHAPEFDQRSAFVETNVYSVAHGDLGGDLEGMLNLPLTSRFATRVVGYVTSGGGFIDNVGTAKHDVNADQVLGGRVSGSYLASDRLSIQATISHQDRETDGLGINNISQGRYRQLTMSEEALTDRWTVSNVVLTYELDDGQVISSTSFLDRWWRDVTDISGFLDFFSASGTVTADHTQDLYELVQELRVSKTRGALEWLGGLFYMKRDQTWDASFPAPGFDASTNGLATSFGLPDNLSIGRVTYDHEHFAAFGELTYSFADSWTGTLGGRYFIISEDAVGNSVGLLASGSAADSSHARNSGFTPKVAVSYTPNAQMLVYATVSEGFRPGGPNFGVPEEICSDSLAAIGLTSAPETYDPDSLWNYELGARSVSRDGRLSASAAAYHMDWSDVQILAFLTCGSGFMDTTGNAQSDGIEFELTFVPREGLELGLNGAYIHAELTRDIPSLGARSGDRMPGVPAIAASGSVTWRSAISSNLAYIISGDANYVDKTYGAFVPAASVRLTAPSRTLVSARVGLEGARWSGFVYCDNLFDEYGIVNTVDDFGLHPGGDWYNVVRPRTVGVTLRASFH